MEAKVIFLLKHPSERIANVGRLNKGCGYLIEQRWKKMIIIDVYKGNMKMIVIGQTFNQINTGKTTTYYHYFFDFFFHINYLNTTVYITNSYFYKFSPFLPLGNVKNIYPLSKATKRKVFFNS